MAHRSRSQPSPKKSEVEEPIRSPIPFYAGSNGEFCPPPPSEREYRAQKLFLELVEDRHKRLGMTRREFAESACGVASALLVINTVYGCSSSKQSSSAGPNVTGNPDSGTSMAPQATDAGFDVDAESTLDEPKACEILMGDEFIFDVQTHVETPISPWGAERPPTKVEDFIRTIFVESDTDVACLTGIPGTRNDGIDNVRARDDLQELIEKLAGPRLIFHANADPALGAGELEYMQQVVSDWKPTAWKVYPKQKAFQMDQPAGLAFVEQGEKLGLNLIAAHRGIDSGGYTADGSPADIVRAAKQMPNTNFLVYHAGFASPAAEDHAFDPDNQDPVGVDRLIKALRDNGFERNQGNVYAELGTTWHRLRTAPSAAAHVLGKLVKYLGEERIVYGSDCVFNGNPQQQIVALRTFKIPAAMREMNEYPALTCDVKRNILGLNGAKLYGVDPMAARGAISDDFVDQLSSSRQEQGFRLPPTRSRGPRTRREFFELLRWEQEFGHG